MNENMTELLNALNLEIQETLVKIKSLECAHTTNIDIHDEDMTWQKKKLGELRDVRSTLEELLTQG